jgi:lipopolysaccharide export system protein LptC
MTMAEESLPARPRRDWTARSRSTAIDALRYTRFVVRMKRMLSFSAFAVIFAVLAFFAVQRAPRQLSLSYERVGSIENDRAMIKPRLTGTDAQGNPFVITADALVQDARNPKRATLQTVEADLTAKQGWFNARAAKGFVDMEVGRLDLSGGIEVFSDGGYQLRTASASVDLKSNVVTGNQEVSGQGPRGTMRADRFHFDRAAGRLTLEGHVRTTITGTGK